MSVSAGGTAAQLGASEPDVETDENHNDMHYQHSERLSLLYNYLRLQRAHTYANSQQHQHTRLHYMCAKEIN